MILLTRNTRTLARELSHRGVDVEQFDLLHKQPLPLDESTLALQHKPYKNVFVASRFVGECWPLNVHAQAKFWAPGASTGKWLAQSFESVSWPNDGEGIQALQPTDDGAWLILTAKAGRSAQLAKQVANADVIELYQTSISQPELARLALRLSSPKPVTIVVTNTQVADALAQLPDAQFCRYIVSSEQVAHCLEQANISDINIAGGASEAALLDAIVKDAS
ncbi:uroporphyrinogen-III synthase [Salinibius halmophilus]|uniref:hypothetical protein n=1 Tax=Salinibius halmophilus TaxID=1853216 RepID=UPI000E66D513|nr:hypothetical protein [Salinibius halmophilus]